MLPASLLGVLSALTSALIWGAADFTGGFATRRSHQSQVLALSSLSGLAVLAVCAAIKGEALPVAQDLLWSTLAGVAGALGLAALYRGLSMGDAARVAPTAAVVGAIVPVGFTFATGGGLDPLRLAGFGLAFLGIWLVSQSGQSDRSASRAEFLLACLAGAGFGFFFILIARVRQELVFTPLIFARLGTLCAALAMMRLRRLPFVPPRANPPALLAGALDVGGNAFFLLARQFARLDVATVLSSLYPASTVLLAALLLKEKVTRPQWLGVILCLGAIALIAA